ncbi:MAG: hypothetical protein MUF34_22610, partial [Polyangiaceae bacterium]|nr:hypothetical protein [Polyangiaceae bacterium]
MTTQNTERTRTRRPGNGNGNGNGHKTGERESVGRSAQARESVGRSAAASKPTRRGAAQASEGERLDDLLHALRAFGGGDFGVRLPGDGRGKMGDVERAFNLAVGRADAVTAEFERLAALVGR